MFLGRDLAAMPWDILRLVLVKFPTCVCLGVPSAKSYLQYSNLTPLLLYGGIHDAWKGAFSTEGAIIKFWKPFVGGKIGTEKDKPALSGLKPTKTNALCSLCWLEGSS